MTKEYQVGTVIHGAWYVFPIKLEDNELYIKAGEEWVKLNPTEAQDAE